LRIHTVEASGAITWTLFKGFFKPKKNFNKGFMEKICDGCEEMRKESDFINSDLCYRCEYAKKMKVSEINRICKCRECGKNCEEKRWIYCSKECAEIGGAKLKKTHWTAQVPYL
jgi:hypothetical protein